MNSQGLVAWKLDAQRFALPVAVVERILPAVELTALPDAPPVISGIVNLHGRVVPAVDIRRRFHLPPRELRLGDRLLLARTPRRHIAFFVDSVEGVVLYPSAAVIAAETIAPDIGSIRGVVKLSDGLMMIQDLDRLLSLEDEQRLSEALSLHACA